MSSTYDIIRIVLIIFSILAFLGGVFCLYMYLSIDPNQSEDGKESREGKESKENEKQSYLIGTITCFGVTGLALLFNWYYTLKSSSIASPTPSRVSTPSTPSKAYSESPECDLPHPSNDERYFAVVKDRTELKQNSIYDSQYPIFLEPGDIVTVVSTQKIQNQMFAYVEHKWKFGYVDLNDIEKFPDQEEARAIVEGDKQCRDRYSIVDWDPPRLARVLEDWKNEDALSKDFHKGDIVWVHNTNICNETHPNVHTFSQISHIESDLRTLVPSDILDSSVQICEIKKYMKHLFDVINAEEIEGTVTVKCELSPYDKIYVYPFERIRIKVDETSGVHMFQTMDGWTGLLGGECYVDVPKLFSIKENSWVTDIENESIYQVMKPINRKQGTYEAKKIDSWFFNDTLDASQVNPIARYGGDVVMIVNEYRKSVFIKPLDGNREGAVLEVNKNELTQYV